MLLAIANDGELDGVARDVFADEGRDSTGFADFDAIDLSNDVFVLEAGFVARAVFDDGTTLGGGGGEVGARSDREIVGGSDVRRDVDIVDSDVGAVCDVVVDDVLEHALDAGDRDGEADTVGVGAGGGIDADDLAGGVDERAARVAGVNGGVGLDHVAEVLGRAVAAVVGRKRAAGAGNNARCNSVLVLAEGVANSDNLLTGV